MIKPPPQLRRAIDFYKDKSYEKVYAEFRTLIKASFDVDLPLTLPRVHPLAKGSQSAWVLVWRSGTTYLVGDDYLRRENLAYRSDKLADKLKLVFCIRDMSIYAYSQAIGRTLLFIEKDTLLFYKHLGDPSSLSALDPGCLRHLVPAEWLEPGCYVLDLPLPQVSYVCSSFQKAREIASTYREYFPLHYWHFFGSIRREGLFSKFAIKSE